MLNYDRREITRLLKARPYKKELFDLIEKIECELNDRVI